MKSNASITQPQAWTMAIRPKTLPAAVAPVVVGIALSISERTFAPLPALAACVTALLIQIGTNLSNDYLDFVKGADVAGRKGPTRVAQSGLIPLGHLRAGTLLVFALAAIIGLYLVWVGGWPILVIGIASIFSALAYTGGPYPLGYHGLGDLFVFLFFGLAAVCGTYYVQALSLPLHVIIASLPVGALTVAILVVNNYRDIETDQEAGKRTLAVFLGPQGTRLEFVALLAVAYGVVTLFWLLGWSSPWVLLPWLTAPLAVRLAHTLFVTTEGPKLNKALAQAANLDLIFSVLFSLGIVL